MFQSKNVKKIDLLALENNYLKIKKYVDEKVEVAAVLKADAYGLGINAAFIKLSALGCSKFYVATLNEAISVRKFSLTDEIFVLHGVLPDQESYFYAQNIIPVICSLEQLDRWNRYGLRKGKKLPAVLMLNTGLNRDGIEFDYIKNNFDLKKYSSIQILHILSHLACAFTPEHQMNYLQLEKMKEIESMFKLPISFVNSSGIYISKDFHFDIVRTGSALYGLTSTSVMDEFEDVVTITSHILNIYRIDSDNEYIGYGSNHKLKKNSKIAVVDIGFSSGLPKRAINGGFCYVAGKKAFIIGSVNMNVITIDVSDIPDKELYVGAEVDIIGGGVTYKDYANICNTSQHEMLVTIGHDFRREYVNVSTKQTK